MGVCAVCLCESSLLGFLWKVCYAVKWVKGTECECEYGCGCEHGCGCEIGVEVVLVVLVQVVFDLLARPLSVVASLVFAHESLLSCVSLHLLLVVSKRCILF